MHFSQITRVDKLSVRVIIMELNTFFSRLLYQSVIVLSVTVRCLCVFNYISQLHSFSNEAFIETFAGQVVENNTTGLQM